MALWGELEQRQCCYGGMSVHDVSRMLYSENSVSAFDELAGLFLSICTNCFYKQTLFLYVHVITDITANIRLCLCVYFIVIEGPKLLDT